MENLSDMIALLYKSIIYIILFILSFLLTYLIKKYAIKKSLVDIPNERSSHSVPTPHGGGIAIAITWFLGISYLFFMGQIDSPLYLALMVGVVISVVSYFDDLYELSAKVRLIFQVGVAVCGLYFLGGFKELDFGIFSITNQLFTNLFALILIIWYINLYNFLDGIDGYAGSEAVFIGIAGYLLFGGNHFLVLAVAVLGFLFWNWERAKIFMGDVGSTLLGYNVAIFTIYYADTKPSDFWIWIILFAVFWADATYTLLNRLRRREKLSQAHKEHIYQKLTQRGWKHSQVVFLLILLNILLYLFVVYMV
jgi:Fuc2NAc and GlcNAc transferase